MSDAKDDKIKTKNKGDIGDEKEIDIENPEIDLEAGSEEPDFAPTTAAPAVDEEDDLEADPHSAFDTPVEVEDPHGIDIYGDGGVPGEDDDEEDEEDSYDGDSNSY